MKGVFLLLVMISVSCSHLKFGHSNVENVDRSGVDLEIEGAGTKILPPREVIRLEHPEETIRIGDQGGVVYETREGELSRSTAKIPKIALVLGPGLNRSVNYISVLKYLDKNSLTPALITGTEMGAVVAALYASGVTPEMIEWMFFKYFREFQNNRPFEKDWIKEVDEAFLMKMKNLKIEDLKIKFIITLFDHNTRKTFYFDRGNVRDLVLINLRLSNNPLRYKTGQAYSGAFEKEIFNHRLMNTLGGEFTIAVDSLQNKIDFENTNEFLYGLMGKVAARGSIEKKQFDYVINLPNQNMKLDNAKDATLALQVSSSFMSKQIVSLKKKIQFKMDQLNSPLENKE